MHRTPNSEAAENSRSVATIFKFFIISSLNLSFLGEVQRDRGPHVGTAQHNSHFFLPLQDGFSALCSTVPESSDHWPPCVSSRVLCTDTGRWGLDMQALGVSRWSMVVPPPAPSRRRAGAVLSDPGTQWGDCSPLGCPSAVDWVSGLEGPCPARSQHLSQGTWEPCSQWARRMCKCVCRGWSAFTLGVSPRPKE